VVFSSAEAKEICEKNSLTFAELLTPFAEVAYQRTYHRKTERGEERRRRTERRKGEEFGSLSVLLFRSLSLSL
jgi:hypothetical protein